MYLGTTSRKTKFNMLSTTTSPKTSVRKLNKLGLNMNGVAIDESKQRKKWLWEVWVNPEGTAIKRVVASATGCRITSTTKSTWCNWREEYCRKCDYIYNISTPLKRGVKAAEKFPWFYWKTIGKTNLSTRRMNLRSWWKSRERFYLGFLIVPW